MLVFIICTHTRTLLPEEMSPDYLPRFLLSLSSSNKMKQQDGFTLIELLVTMGIIAVLTGMAVYNFNQSRVRARDVQRKSDLSQLVKSLELYKIDNGTFPDTWGLNQVTLTEGGYSKVEFVDPKGSDWYDYVYTYTGDAKNYTIKACLENVADSTRLLPTTKCPDVVNGTGVIYQVSNP